MKKHRLYTRYFYKRCSKQRSFQGWNNQNRAKSVAKLCKTVSFKNGGRIDKEKQQWGKTKGRKIVSIFHEFGREKEKTRNDITHRSRLNYLAERAAKITRRVEPYFTMSPAARLYRSACIPSVDTCFRNNREKPRGPASIASIIYRWPRHTLFCPRNLSPWRCSSHSRKGWTRRV